VNENILFRIPCTYHTPEYISQWFLSILSNYNIILVFLELRDLQILVDIGIPTISAISLQFFNIYKVSLQFAILNTFDIIYVDNYSITVGLPTNEYNQITLFN
jgi:hypothetical protein